MNSNPEASSEKSGGGFILPLPLLKIPPKPMETHQQHKRNGGKLDSPPQKLYSPIRKVNLPIYDCQNPDDRIYRRERCFSVNQTDVAKISIKRYHKARKKDLRPTVVPDFEASASSVRYLGIHTIKMKERYVGNEKVNRRDLVKAIKSYGMRFRFSYSGDSNRNRQIGRRRLIEDTCVKGGSIILDYGLQSQDSYHLDMTFTFGDFQLSRPFEAFLEISFHGGALSSGDGDSTLRTRCLLQGENQDNRDVYLQLIVTFLAALCRVPEIAYSVEIISRISLIPGIALKRSDTNSLEKYEPMYLVSNICEASVMAMSKFLELFSNEEGIEPESVFCKGQYEEVRDTVTKLVFYKTEVVDGLYVGSWDYASVFHPWDRLTSLDVITGHAITRGTLMSFLSIGVKNLSLYLHDNDTDKEEQRSYGLLKTDRVWEPGGFISAIQQCVETVKGPHNKGDKHGTGSVIGYGLIIGATNRHYSLDSAQKLADEIKNGWNCIRTVARDIIAVVDWSQKEINYLKNASNMEIVKLSDLPGSKQKSMVFFEHHQHRNPNSPAQAEKFCFIEKVGIETETEDKKDRWLLLMVEKIGESVFYAEAYDNHIVRIHEAEVITTGALNALPQFHLEDYHTQIVSEEAYKFKGSNLQDRNLKGIGLNENSVQVIFNAENSSRVWVNIEMGSIVK